MQKYSILREELLSNPGVLNEYKKLEPRYMLIKSVIDKRLALGITQQQLAERIGTKQSAIARFESGNTNPSLGFISKIASALETQLTISLVD